MGNWNHTPYQQQNYYWPNGARSLIPTNGVSTTKPVLSTPMFSAPNLQVPSFYGNPADAFKPQSSAFSLFRQPAGPGVNPPSVQDVIRRTDAGMERAIGGIGTLPASSTGSVVQPQYETFQGVQPLNTNGGMTVGMDVQGLGGTNYADLPPNPMLANSRTAPVSMWQGIKNFFGGDSGSDGILRDNSGNPMLNDKGNVVMDPNHISAKDVWTGIGGALQTGLGAYNMFQDINYKKDLIANQRAELNFAKEQFAEKKRIQQSVANMNKWS